MVIAQAEAPKGNSLVMFFPILIFIVMMFFLFRSQQKATKQRQKMIDEIATGKKVITNGGVIGIITNIKDNSFIVKVADNVKIEIAKNGINTVVDDKAKDQDIDPKKA